MTEPRLAAVTERASRLDELASARPPRGDSNPCRVPERASVSSARCGGPREPGDRDRPTGGQTEMPTLPGSAISWLVSWLLVQAGMTVWEGESDSYGVMLSVSHDKDISYIRL